MIMFRVLFLVSYPHISVYFVLSLWPCEPALDVPLDRQSISLGVTRAGSRHEVASPCIWHNHIVSNVLSCSCICSSIADVGQFHNVVKEVGI